MTIYLDLLLFENFIFNFFIFYVSFKMLNYELNIKKLIISCLISSFLNILILFKLDSSTYLYILILISFFTNVILCTPKFNIKYFIQIFTTLVVVSFLVFGSVSFIKINIKNINYFHIVIMFAIIFVIFDISKKYIKRNTFFDNCIFNVTLKYNDVIYNFNGFLDTGNELREPITGLPVVIIETRCMPGIFYNEKYYYRIPYKVITGNISYFEGIKIKNVFFKNSSHEFYTDIILCTTKMCLDSEKRFDAILSRCII